MKKKISFAFILAIVLMIACAATALAGAVNENFNAWLYQIWPEAATTLMPVNMSCENNGIRMEVISAVADGKELYITYSLEDLEGDRLNIENSPILYVNSYPDYLWGASFEQPMKDEATGKVIFGEHFRYQESITATDGVLKAHLPSFTSFTEIPLIDLFPYLEQYGGEVRTMDAPENARTLWAHDSYLEEKPVDGEVLASMRVIDNSANLEIPLADTVFLSGIGMVDGRLHVQLHYVNHRKGHEITSQLEQAVSFGEQVRVCGHHAVLSVKGVNDGEEIDGGVQQQEKYQERSADGLDEFLAYG